MKRLVVFLLLLCFQLSGRNGHALASPFHTPGNFAHNVTSVKTPFNGGGSLHKLQVAKDSGIAEDATYQVNVDDEDENEDSVEKHVPTARYAIAFASAFLSDYYYKCRVTPCYITGHLPGCASCKYIRQRALRL